MRRPHRKGLIAAGLAALLAAALVPLGCNRSGTDEVRAQLSPTSVRAGRRAYDGAPPVIPHEPLAGTCVNCHTVQGRELPGLGFAPANPHHETPGLSAVSNCRQCHVFSRSDDLFVETGFVPLKPAVRHGDRLYPGAPPVMPHPLFMRENCHACHATEAARPEIRCSHPERRNCLQCHNRQVTTDSAFHRPLTPLPDSDSE